MKVKICGITNTDDALLCAAAGADALGFIFFDGSPRSVDIETAAKISKSLPCFVSKVGVFVDADKSWVETVARRVGLDTLQFHGKEDADYCNYFMNNYKVIKAFFPSDESIADRMKDYNVSAYLLDIPFEDKLDKPEAILDIDTVNAICKRFKWVIYSGGLTIDNLEGALDVIKPYAIDLARGTEEAPGEKDPELVEKLMKLVKKYR